MRREARALTATADTVAADGGTVGSLAGSRDAHALHVLVSGSLYTVGSILNAVDWTSSSTEGGLLT